MSMLNVDDTIVAIASPPGGAVRGVIRLSGPNVTHCLDQSFEVAAGRQMHHLRRATMLRGWLRVPPPVGHLECDLYLWPNERSYTRQPAAELHTFGSPPLLDAAMRTLCAAGARLAEPGEFTLRAFLAGRLDLTQAEAVLGVIEAQTRSELRAALTQLAGGLAHPLHQLCQTLMDLLAHLEAGLDFVDESVEFISAGELTSRLEEASNTVANIERQLMERTEREDAPRVMLFGWPNVGKSSLFNALAGDAAAIVSPLQGTTRDYITRHVVFGGRELLLIDTAGVDAGDASGDDAAVAAQVAIEAQRAQADLQLFCLDATRQANAWEKEQIAANDPQDRLIVATKTDAADTAKTPACDVPTSARTGHGVAALRRAISERLDSLPNHELLTVANTATRCHESMRGAARALSRAHQLVQQNQGEELVAAELRLSLDELGRVVGTVYTDDVLDHIFSRFCIGK